MGAIMSSEINNEVSVKELQIKLNQMGYGPIEEDGLLGSETRKAIVQYENALANTPLPPKPWWKSRRMRGLVKTVLGLLVMVVPFLAGVDVDELNNNIWDIADNLELIIASVGAIMVMFGETERTKGAINATGPIDKTLVTTIRGREIRIGRKPTVPEPFNYLGDFAE